jgi:hypothetical protein
MFGAPVLGWSKSNGLAITPGNFKKKIGGRGQFSNTKDITDENGNAAVEGDAKPGFPSGC